MNDTQIAAAEAAASLSGYLDAGELDPGRLDHVAGRLADLDRLKRRYGPSLEDVLARFEEARASLTALAEAPERLKRLEQGLAAAFNIRSIPTVMAFRDNILLFVQPGLLDASQLDDLIEKLQALDMNDIRRQIAEREAASPASIE